MTSIDSMPILLKDIVCPWDKAVTLHERGLDKEYPLFWWRIKGGDIEVTDKSYKNSIPAYTAEELGNMIPGKFQLPARKMKEGKIISYNTGIAGKNSPAGENEPIKIVAKSEADARAQFLLLLDERDLI